MPINYQDLKRARLDQQRSTTTIDQVEHVAGAGAKLTMGGVLQVGDVLSEDASAAPIKVMIGSILRIQVSADTYIAFDDLPSNLSATVDATTTPGLKLPTGYHLVVATGNFMKASANPTRIERINIDLSTGPQV